MERAGALTPEDSRLLSFLKHQWDQLFHLTTIQQGMLALGQELDDGRRLRIADHLLAHPETHPTLERWGAPTFILSEEEKLLARHLTARAVEDRGEIGVGEAAEAIGCDKLEVPSRLAVLGHVKLFQWRTQDDIMAYSLPADWEQRAGPLAFTFHTVERQNGERFNVPCALDFLLLAWNDYPRERLGIFDSCAHCTERIHAVIHPTQTVDVEPSEALVFRGGG